MFLGNNRGIEVTEGGIIGGFTVYAVLTGHGLPGTMTSPAENLTTYSSRSTNLYISDKPNVIQASVSCFAGASETDGYIALSTCKNY